MQSNLRNQLHVGIIMDGNGRWAIRRNLPREAGHHAGVAALREIVGAAPANGIETLTVYAFSSDNWRRPEAEIGALMRLFRNFLETETARLVRTGVRLTVIGRRDRLPAGIDAAIAHAEKVTADGRELSLRIAIDYSARDAILAAAVACWPGQATREELSQHLANGAAHPDVDLVIRTSGEQRLSDFLLWEAAYAELYFTEVLWPDFGAEELAEAIQSFRSRDRRFGGIADKPSPAMPVAAVAAPPPPQRPPLFARARALFTGATL